MSKVLSAAGAVFEAKWDTLSYLVFLEENGFTVKNARQLASTIPLLDAECVTILRNSAESKKTVSSRLFEPGGCRLCFYKER